MYVTYEPAAPMPMGPPAVGAAPPTLAAGSLFEAYTSGMSAADVTRFRSCMHDKVVAAGDGATRNEYYPACRDQVWGVTPPAPPGASSLASLPPWAIYAGAGAGVFLLVHLLTR